MLCTTAEANISVPAAAHWPLPKICYVCVGSGPGPGLVLMWIRITHVKSVVILVILWVIVDLTWVNNNNNNRRLVTLAEHTSDHGRQTNSSTEEKGEQV